MRNRKTFGVEREGVFVSAEFINFFRIFKFLRSNIISYGGALSGPCLTVLFRNPGQHQHHLHHQKHDARQKNISNVQHSAQLPLPPVLTRPSRTSAPCGEACKSAFESDACRGSLRLPLATSGFMHRSTCRSKYRSN